MAYSLHARPLAADEPARVVERRDECSEELVRMAGLRIVRCPRGRVSILTLDEAAPAALHQAVEHCLSVRERVGGFAGLVVFRRDIEPGRYAIHTQLVGHLGDVIGAGWDLGRRLELFTRVARAVQGLHEIGECVQALSPQHVLLNAGSSPHVLGPGLVVPEAEPYQAPESRDRGLHDIGSDVFCLGALLHFLLAGQAPPRLEVDGDLPSLQGIELKGLRRIVRKACAPDPRTRYAGVFALLADLNQHVDADRVGVGHASDEAREEQSGPLELGQLQCHALVAAE